MHHMFVNKEAVEKLRFYASSCYQHGSGVIVAMFMFMIIKEVAVFKVSESWYVLYDRRKG